MTDRRQPGLLAVAGAWAADPAGWPVPLRFDPASRWYAGSTRPPTARSGR
ncbi:hypothetical protein ACGF5C_04610 [Micromonospora sp. NPDC047620]